MKWVKWLNSTMLVSTLTTALILQNLQPCVESGWPADFANYPPHNLYDCIFMFYACTDLPGFWPKNKAACNSIYSKCAKMLASKATSTQEFVIVLSLATRKGRIVRLDDFQWCQDLPDFPVQSVLPSGAWSPSASKLTVCADTSQCFTWRPRDTQWAELAKISDSRVGAAAIEYNGTIMITGGGNQLSELIDIETQVVRDGPKVPMEVTEHCFLWINQTTAMFIGGLDYKETSRRETYYYDWRSQAFSPGPELIQERSFHACGVLSADEKAHLIVSGGWNGNGLSTTEVLDLSGTPPTWLPGPKLPYDISHKMIVSHGGSVYLPNDQGIVHKLDCVKEGCSWKELSKKITSEEQLLQSGFHTDLLLFKVSGDLFQC